MANSLFGKQRFERDMNDELQLHIELQTKANIEKGMGPKEARRQAMIEFGGIENVREEARETRALAWMTGIWRDVHISVRGLLHEPGFSVVCVFVLALAIGANSTVFSLINATFLRSLPYHEPDRIVQIWETMSGSGRTSVNYLNFKEWQERQDCFSRIAMSLGGGVTMRNGMKSARLQGDYITDGYFELLGVKPAIGRSFKQEDDLSGAPGVAVITAGVWHDHFGADPDIVGKSVQVDNRMITIIGVMPDNFRHYQDADIFMPLGPVAESMYLTSRNNRNGNTVLGRLAPGVELPAARTQFMSIATALAKTYPQNEGVSVDMAPMQEAMGQDSHERVFLLYGAVGLFLLIACVNLSNMFLARGMARTREMAVRAALGATQRQIVRQLLIESLVMSAIGGVLGIVFAWQASSFVGQLIPWEIRHTLDGGNAFDMRVCLFAIALTFITGIIFGLAPALRLSHTRPSGALKENGGATGRKGHLSGSDILVMAQVALVAVLMVSTGLLVRSLQRVMETPSGINPDNLITFQTAGPTISTFRTDPNSVSHYYLDTLDSIEQIPGVESAAFCGSMPYTWQTSQMTIYRMDRPVPEHSDRKFTYMHWASQDVFRTLDIPLLKGRLFDDGELVFKYPDGVPVAPENFERIFGGLVVDCVVNKRMAEMIWPDEDPIGKRLHMGPPEMEMGTAQVVGVVGNILTSGVENGEVPEIYVPFRSLPIPNGVLFFAVRSRGDPADMMRTISQRLSDLRPDHPVYDMHLMEERMSWFVSDRRFTVQILGAFSIAALLLAAAGIYGVLAYITARRTREIAIRLTLGATRRSVLWNVLRHGTLLITVGLGIGLVASFFIQKLIQSQLFGVSATDPVTFLLGAIVLTVVGIVACLIPAWRASRIDPMSTLRSN